MNLERSDFSPFDQISAWWLNVLLSFVLWKKKRISVEKNQTSNLQGSCIFPLLSEMLWLGLFVHISCLCLEIHPFWSSVQFNSVQSLSRVRLFATPWIAAHQASLSITNSQSSPKPMSIELVMPSSHLILCHPLLLLPPHPSQHQGLFQWVNSSHEVAKVLEFQLQHQSFQWIFRTDLL